MSEHDDDLIPPDPRFPDRPHTLDFARLSSAAAEQDAVADMLGIEQAAKVDLDSLIYMAKGRLGKVGILPTPQALSLYVDAFHLGVGFQERGGHRPNETGNAGEGGTQ